MNYLSTGLSVLHLAFACTTENPHQLTMPSTSISQAWHALDAGAFLWSVVSLANVSFERLLNDRRAACVGRVLPLLKQRTMACLFCSMI